MFVIAISHLQRSAENLQPELVKHADSELVREPGQCSREGFPGNIDPVLLSSQKVVL